jgi:hypothetical protein
MEAFGTFLIIIGIAYVAIHIIYTIVYCIALEERTRTISKKLRAPLDRK